MLLASRGSVLYFFLVLLMLVTVMGLQLFWDSQLQVSTLARYWQQQRLDTMADSKLFALVQAIQHGERKPCYVSGYLAGDKQDEAWWHLAGSCQDQVENFAFQYVAEQIEVLSCQLPKSQATLWQISLHTVMQKDSTLRQAWVLVDDPKHHCLLAQRHLGLQAVW